MKHQAKSVRTFIGAKDFEVSRKFYHDLGFEESQISKNMSYFKISDGLGFYLQDAYVQDWVNNSMIFLEVDNVEQHWKEVQNLGLHNKYKEVKLTLIKHDDWGREYFLHDPSGILWHFGEFNK
ncbi:MAG: glyoxalase [Bacteroidota bacterium]|nr:glyoxalase [Bacteroidota bacterium]